VAVSSSLISGHRFNSSTREFGFAYRSLTTTMLMKAVPSANCVSDQDDLLVSLRGSFK